MAVVEAFIGRVIAWVSISDGGEAALAWVMYTRETMAVLSTMAFIYFLVAFVALIALVNLAGRL